MVGLISSHTFSFENPQNGVMLSKTDPIKMFHEKGANPLTLENKEELLAHLEKLLESLKFGSITLVVQDGKIVQIEKNEKVRLQSNKNR